MSDAKKPWLKQAKPIHARKILRDCDIGDVVEFTAGAPDIHVRLGDVAKGPSKRARVVSELCGSVWVRFFLEGGKETEMMRPDQEAAIVRLDGTR